MVNAEFEPTTLLKPRRSVEGISAILLPFLPDGAIDWPGFRDHVRRTVEAKLTPAVNMDTGYVPLLDPETRLRVLREMRAITSGAGFVAGAFVADRPGAAWDLDESMKQVEAIESGGGTPILFQSHGLTEQGDEGIVESYRAVGSRCDRFLGFELGSMFAKFGKVYSLDVYRAMMGISSCVGAKHSSLDRVEEWKRLMVRDGVRPDFRVYTGNDLAIDMIMYGSDYLLGLSTFAPDAFAVRDRFWASGDPEFYELNDMLQYLGQFAFRPPVPAYKHSAAMFLKMRGWIATDSTHPGSPTRPDSDRDVLAEILQRLRRWVD